MSGDENADGGPTRRDPVKYDPLVGGGLTAGCLGGNNGADHQPSEPATGIAADSTATRYDDWSDERLVDGYRRNSRLLRECGSDERTIRALCAIEERLRARGIDPDEIVAELDE